MKIKGIAIHLKQREIRKRLEFIWKLLSIFKNRTVHLLWKQAEPEIRIQLLVNKLMN